MNKNRGITIISLIVTVIVLIILTGVAIVSLKGENQLFGKASTATEKTQEQVAKEKLENFLLNMKLEKQTNPDYTEDFFINQLTSNGMAITEDKVYVNDWLFVIDQEMLQIKTSMGKVKLNEAIKVASNKTISHDFTTAMLQVDISYEGEIAEIEIQGQKEEVPVKQEGKYVLQKEVKQNANYSVFVKDKENGYQMQTISITELTDNMEIRTAEDLKTFRNKVNEGRNFKGKKVTLVNDINLNEGKYTKNQDGSVSFQANAESWEPIQKEFCGTFSGNGKTIYGLYCNNEATNLDLVDQGIFTKVTNQGRIENLKVKEGLIYAGSYTGVISARLIDSTLFGCYTDVSIKYKNETDKRHGCAIAGLCRYSE